MELNQNLYQYCHDVIYANLPTKYLSP